MNWIDLLSHKRLGCNEVAPLQIGRSPFQQDYDRIIFSLPFRKLSDKTQVFPPCVNDYVRTRLPHSLEAASIGRSLGAGVGAFVLKNCQLENILVSDFGAVVAAATLAHDIGNTPLGHSGEEAIRYWFANSKVAAQIKSAMSRSECEDIARYEGNAQGFRVVSRLQMSENYGGMRLTCATLGAFAKYPCCSLASHTFPFSKKFSFFESEKNLFSDVAKCCGLIQYDPTIYAWSRHPLAFLVEAADDIAYRIVDYEDAFVCELITYEQLEKHFMQIIRQGAEEYVEPLRSLQERQHKVEYMRARAVGVLIEQVIGEFIKNYDAIMNGEYTLSLINSIPAAEIIVEINAVSYEKIYKNQYAAESAAAGFEIFGGLLDVFIPVVEELAQLRNEDKLTFRNRVFAQLLPNYCKKVHDKNWCNNVYLRAIGILDFIAGMTDSHAVTLYQKIKGVALPGSTFKPHW